MSGNWNDLTDRNVYVLTSGCVNLSSYYLNLLWLLSWLSIDNDWNTKLADNWNANGLCLNCDRFWGFNVACIDEDHWLRFLNGWDWLGGDFFDDNSLADDGFGVRDNGNLWLGNDGNGGGNQWGGFDLFVEDGDNWVFNSGWDGNRLNWLATDWTGLDWDCSENQWNFALGDWSNVGVHHDWSVNDLDRLSNTVDWGWLNIRNDGNLTNDRDNWGWLSVNLNWNLLGFNSNWGWLSVTLNWDLLDVNNDWNWLDVTDDLDLAGVNVDWDWLDVTDDLDLAAIDWDLGRADNTGDLNDWNLAIVRDDWSFTNIRDYWDLTNVRNDWDLTIINDHWLNILNHWLSINLANNLGSYSRSGINHLSLNNLSNSFLFNNWNRSWNRCWNSCWNRLNLSAN